MLTIGHPRRSLAELIALLECHEVAGVLGGTHHPSVADESARRTLRVCKGAHIDGQFVARPSLSRKKGDKGQ